MEGDFVALINNERAARGLAPLQWDGALVGKSHTKAMIEADALFHNLPALPGYSRLGENVGRGPNVSTLHAAFMASSGHRANILGDFNRVGVYAMVNDAGMMYVTVRFGKVVTPETTSTTIPPTTTTQPRVVITAPVTTTTIPAPLSKFHDVPFPIELEGGYIID